MHEYASLLTQFISEVNNPEFRFGSNNESGDSIWNITLSVSNLYNTAGKQRYVKICGTRLSSKRFSVECLFRIMALTPNNFHCTLLS